MHKNFTFLYAAAFFFSFHSCECNKQVFSIDPGGNWIRHSDFSGPPRSEAVSFVIDKNVYLCTGYTNISATRLKDCWQLDPVTDIWTQRADFPGNARNSAVGFNIVNKGYAGTGYDGNNMLRDFWEYDPSANTWTQKADFGGIARDDAVGFSIQNSGYIATGSDGNNTLKDLWEYNPSSNLWIQKPDLKGTQRSAAVSFVYHNKAYIATGVNGDTAVNDFWVFDPSQPDTTSWKQLRSISNVSPDPTDDGYTNICRWNASAFIILGTVTGDKAYISTGENKSLYTFTWEYDFATDLWKEKTPFENSPRTGAVGFTLQNRGFIMTGRNNTTDFSDIFEFKPNEVYNSND